MSGRVRSNSTRFSSFNAESINEQVAFYREETHFNLPLIFPWSWGYKLWWGFTVVAATFTIFFETYQIAFSLGGLAENGAFVLEFILLAVFLVDMVVNFNLAYYDDKDNIIFSRRAIARNYMRSMFWVDLIGVFPFYLVALQATGQLGETNQFTQNLSLLRLFKMVRLHRVYLFFSVVQYSSKISLLGLTLLRDFSAVLVWTHTWACIMFFIAREAAFDSANTWLGSSISELTGLERYVTSLYWSVVTFTSVGYGDFSPVTSIEQIFGIVYMLLNVVLMSWVIGSITLVIVKSDEKTGLYRQALHALHKYASLHNFDKSLTKRLRTMLKLDFESKEIADEQVLQFFPEAVRQKILRKLYLPALLETKLMKGTRQQFSDAFLSLCKVEIFSSGEEILQRGSISADLYLLLDGTVHISMSNDDDKLVKDTSFDGDLETSVAPTSVADSTENFWSRGSKKGRKVNSKEFLNELGFFTESPQMDTVRTKTVCKVLTMSRSNYRNLAADHPGSAGVVLNNLLSKVEDLPQSNRIRWDSESDIAVAEVHAMQAKVAVQELVKMHISKQKDDHTTRFCFAASRGDIATITSMCDHGFNPDSSDYDQRNALMVSSMKGNVDVVKKLLDYNANPNLTDMHGTSALFEAVKNNREEVVDVLLKHGGEFLLFRMSSLSQLC
ncbi:hypothetical protein HJC23_006967 [Cyclotella cryptica]|uniref:Cyclic nucleotide-binding domain-containing protein n=1 Tax=Cyclotella cryptica TaxID=29204 RepID=A0ABD3QLQ4_9STRA